MQKVFFLAHIFFIFFGGQCLRAEAPENAVEGNAAITVSDYCVFLNSVAASDSHHLFEREMATDPVNFCIVRTGGPGSYYYEVIDGKDNSPITWISPLSAVRYDHWKEDQIGSELSDQEMLTVLSQDDNISITSDPSLLQANRSWGVKQYDEQSKSFKKQEDRDVLEGGVSLLVLMMSVSCGEEVKLPPEHNEENNQRPSTPVEASLPRSERILECDDLMALSNFTGQCGLNSALQMARQASQNILEHGTPEEQERIRVHITQQMPCFGRFVRQEICTDDDCRALHQEVLRTLPLPIQGCCFSHLGSAVQRNIYRSSPSTKGISSLDVLETLFRKLGVPFLKRMGCTEGGTFSPQELSSGGALPSLFAISSSSFFHPTEEKRIGDVIYEPQTIICSLPSSPLKPAHAFSLIKKNGFWYEVNNKYIFRTPKAWKNDLSEYCVKYASVILYKKQVFGDSSSVSRRCRSHNFLTTEENIFFFC